DSAADSDNDSDATVENDGGDDTKAVPPPPHAPGVPAAPHTGFAYRFEDSGKERFSYVLANGNEENFTGSGESADWDEVHRIHKRLDHDFLWVRIGDDRYLIEDPSTLAKVKEAFRPQQELGDRQGRLGSIQAEIGAQQGAIGDQQARV